MNFSPSLGYSVNKSFNIKHIISTTQERAGQNPLTFINLFQSLKDILHGLLVTTARATTQLLSLPPAITLTSVHRLLLPPEVSALVEVLEPVHGAALDIAVGFPSVIVSSQTCTGSHAEPLS